MATNPFAEFATPAENPFAAFAAPPQAAPPYFEISGVGSTGVPGPRRAPGLGAQLGRTAASLADVTLGGILPGAAQYLAYPLARLQRSPEEAQAITQNLVGAIDKPFGKAFGVTETPEYQQESGRQLMDFIGQNFQKGAKFIAEKTGIPAADVESYMATLSLTAPKVVPPVAKAVTEAVAPVVQDIRAGVQLPFEPMLQKGRERRSAESYARAPELDAIAEAQRLKLVIDPRKIDPSSVMARGYSLAAGPRGPEAMVTTNKPRVTQIAKDELGLDATTSLTSTAPFKQARANVAAPYDEVAKLPTMVADETTIASLNDLRRNDKLIGGKGVSEKVNKLIDDAVDKTQAGLNGAELLENVRVLRADAQKIYKNQSATPKQIAVADANLAIATQLESMIDSNIFNPRLLDEWRGARQDMARTYAYEGATDFNTGTVDVAKLARITSKDNALTGDIASLGKIAGNFPEAFAPSAESKFFSVPRLTRAGISGTAGALIGGAAFDTPGYILGTAAGSLLGEISGKLAANRLASPSYQAGLQLQDFRIPVNQLAAAAAPIPQNRAVVPYEPEVVGPSAGGPANKLRIIGYDQEGRPIYKAEESRPGFTMPQQAPEFGPTVFESQRGLPNEVPRQIYEAQKRAELAQGFRETAERKPAAGEVILDFDPITGRFREASQGIKGATPDIFSGSTGKTAITAAEKMRAGQQFLMTAEEKIQWGKSLLEGMPVAQGETVFGKLSPQQITTKMADREWVASKITKAREQAAAFEQIAARAQDERARQTAIAARERMMDLAEQMEEGLRTSRPDVSGKQQGPKTRAAKRNALAPDNQNNLAP